MEFKNIMQPSYSYRFRGWHRLGGKHSRLPASTLTASLLRSTKILPYSTVTTVKSTNGQGFWIRPNRWFSATISSRSVIPSDARSDFLSSATAAVKDDTSLKV